MAGRVFISYRRADTANQAGWLADRLAGHYGWQQVVRDVDSIQLGNDFAEVIAAAVTSCDVLVALIGHQWLAAAAGPNDFVRVEIESALTRGVQVIPVLIDGARMPAAAELPPSLAFIAIPSGGHPAASASSASSAPAAGSHNNASPKTGNSPGPSAPAKVLVADDFSTSKVGWADDYHQTAGAYTGTVTVTIDAGV